MIELSDKTAQLVECIFAGNGDKQEVIELLRNECADGVPFCNDATPEKMERIRFSVLKLSEGNLLKAKEAVELANVDWRDLFMAADFGEDIETHMHWCQEVLANE